jgi:hypothetical protein
MPRPAEVIFWLVASVVAAVIVVAGGAWLATRF